jgi:DNA-binding LacI/PurR family transcriptional regulator
VDCSHARLAGYSSALRQAGIELDESLITSESGRKVVTVQINGCDIRIIHATTDELIRELTLNPAVDYQARGARKPRPKPS